MNDLSNFLVIPLYIDPLVCLETERSKVDKA